MMTDGAGPRRPPTDNPKSNRTLPREGLVLLDLSLRVLACDQGAATILNIEREPHGAEAVSGIPKDIVEQLRNPDTKGTAWSRLRFRVEKSEYTCRPYLLEPNNGRFAQGALALHLEKVTPADRAILDVIARYNLTEREHETLRGVLNGLTIKEVADQMGISPNTVKAFLRLVMIKFGVTTRWGIITKILADRDDLAGEPKASPARGGERGVRRLRPHTVV